MSVRSAGDGSVQFCQSHEFLVQFAYCLLVKRTVVVTPDVIIMTTAAIRRLLLDHVEQLTSLRRQRHVDLDPLRDDDRLLLEQVVCSGDGHDALAARRRRQDYLAVCRRVHLDPLGDLVEVEDGGRRRGAVRRRGGRGGHLPAGQDLVLEAIDFDRLPDGGGRSDEKTADVQCRDRLGAE